MTFLSPIEMGRYRSIETLWFTIGFLCLGLIGMGADALAEDGGTPVRAELWTHLSSDAKAINVRGMSAHFDDSGDRRVLRLEVPELNVALGEIHSSGRGIAWVGLPPPAEGWDLGSAECVQARVQNAGATPAEVTLWVVGSNGWTAVGDSSVLKPSESTTLRCLLRETFPDGTPKIDPIRIKEIRVMVQRADTAAMVVSDMIATGTVEPWVRPTGRIDVPDMVEGSPAPGRRVRYRLSDDPDAEIYGTLYLPPDWNPNKRYPVIAEFPGNIFFHAKACWSTGRPEQCQMGYGITLGTDAIWVSLPFVDRETGQIAEAGFGSREGDDTAAYTVRVIDDICANWGGDRDNLILCGFSRGAIACGYIGLRNDTIAGLWKGFVACQHYDGSNWRQSRMEDAIERAPRFRGRAIFQVDNSGSADNTGGTANYEQLMAHTDPAVKWTWVSSGLGSHATAMFLDDRPSTQQLRQWFDGLQR
ncbi:hypothetical protein [Neorhodopirellula pilleata]|nr:hypothetical protein [Neorhodopirellula pilleata]